MKKIRFRNAFLLFFFIWIALPVQAQMWKLKKANQYYERLDYVRAVPLYESLKEKDADIYRKLGKAYYVMGDFEKAKDAYEKVIQTGKYKPEDAYNYAYYLRVNGQYPESNKWMMIYARMRPGDSRVKRFLKDPDYYVELLKFNPGVKINNVEINKKYEDFGPSLYHDSLVVFSSSRKLFAKNWKGNDQPFLDLYTAKIVADTNLTDVKSFSGRINSRFHDGPADFNATVTYMVLTRNIDESYKITENKLWLFQSHIDQEGEWTEPVALHFNSHDYSCGHPALTADGNKMYFTSDMPGGFGGLDIYVVEKVNDTTWGEPKNLGPEINTEGNEMFPSWNNKNRYLFFASDGLPGLGGMDIFVVKIQEDGEMSYPVNLGAPINSSYDDFSFLYMDNESGFYSSNHPGGKGSDDLYGFNFLKRFKKTADIFYLIAHVRDSLTGKSIPANVALFEKEKNIAGKDLAPGEEFKTRVRPGHSYQLVISSPDYITKHITVNITTDLKTTLKDVALVTTHQKQLKDLCSVGIRPLYYDLDKYYIRDNDKPKLDSVVALMKKFPEIKVEVGSHTDSRATKAYNMGLSKNRSISAVKYLVDHGIPEDRLLVKWFGESQPVNGCVDGVKCTEEQHQMNRRTEFKIINCDQIMTGQ